MSRPIVVIVCMTWLLRIVGALTAPTSMALTCRWRSRRPGRAKKPCKWMFLVRGLALPALVPAFGLGEPQDRRFGGKAPWAPGSYVPIATCTADRCNPDEEAPPRARPFPPSRVARRPFIDADAVEQS